MDRTIGLLYEAAHEGNVTTLLELLKKDKLILDRAIVVNINGFSETPLHVAAMLGHADFVKEITARKPELAKELDTWRSTPLHLAAAKGHLETVKVLLSLVDSVNMCFAVDREGRNPLHLAAMRGHLDVLRELLSVAPGADRVTLEGRRETVLHLCVRYNQLEALRLLVKVLDDYQFVNAKDDYGMTVLHLAVADKQIQTVKFLLANTSIEVNAINANGFTAFDILAQSQRNEKDFDISEYLRAARAFRTIDNPQNQAKGSSSSTSSSSSSSKGHPPSIPHNQNQISETKLPKDDHKTKKPEDWLSRKREALMVVASLMATMAFQAGTNPPGGLWQDDSRVTVSLGAPIASTSSDTHRAGKSIMAYRESDKYNMYLYCNTIGFVSSLSIILLLITGLPFCRKFFMWILTVIMWVTITFMALTYGIFIICFTPFNQERGKAIEYSLLAWIGVMGLVLLLHTIRVMANLLKKLVNCLINLMRN